MCFISWCSAREKKKNILFLFFVNYKTNFVKTGLTSDLLKSSIRKRKKKKNYVRATARKDDQRKWKIKDEEKLKTKR